MKGSTQAWAWAGRSHRPALLVMDEALREPLFELEDSCRAWCRRRMLRWTDWWSCRRVDRPAKFRALMLADEAKGTLDVGVKRSSVMLAQPWWWEMLNGRLFPPKQRQKGSAGNSSVPRDYQAAAGEQSRVFRNRKFGLPRRRAEMKKRVEFNITSSRSDFSRRFSMR